MKTASNTIPRPPVSRDYLNLVRRFVLRPIRSQQEHKIALGILSDLMTKGDDHLTDGENDYLAALARFVSDYEREHLLSALKPATPREVLEHLMESRMMNSAQLGDILGSRSAATMILKGQRELSKAHIRTAADYFGVSPAVFL